MSTVATLKISIEALQTKLYMDQAVGVAKVGPLPAVFITLRREPADVASGRLEPDALTAMSAERARELALALWQSADAVDRLSAEGKEDA